MHELKLPNTLANYPNGPWRTHLKNELRHWPGLEDALQRGLRRSSHALSESFELVILSHQCDADMLELKLGIFYRGIVAGCACADDPSPENEENEYCEWRIHIGPPDGQTRFCPSSE